ncbi:MAG: hypothetical protein ACHP9T_12380 [Caulobacterales bacterium]
MGAGGAKAQGQITLNLVCTGGRYVAQFFTNQNDYTSITATGAEGHAALTFRDGTGLGRADLALNGKTLAGSFDLEDDRGTIRLERVGPALGLEDMQPRLDLTPAQWRQDLKVFAAELPARHAKAFATLSRAAFAAQVAALDRRLPRLNGDEAYVGLDRIANLIGDGHTNVAPPRDLRRLPLKLARFGGDVRIVAAGPGLEAGLGARVLRIGKLSTEEAYRRALTLTPAQEFMPLREGRALTYLAAGALLHGLDITADRTHAPFTVQTDDRRTLTVDVRGQAPGETASLESVAKTIPLWKTHREKTFWCQDLPAERTVYCAFHAYPDLQARAAEMFALLDKVHPQKLIIDMRDNGGGNYLEGHKWLIKPISERPDLNRKGRLFVLVGATTFSAAMNNAAQFQDETKAILVGQTIGERPNSYQEPRQFRLPNSHLIVRASTLFYRFRKTGENAVRPDKEIVPSWADAKAGRDPVVDWVLAQP